MKSPKILFHSIKIIFNKLSINYPQTSFLSNYANGVEALFSRNQFCILIKFHQLQSAPILFVLIKQLFRGPVNVPTARRKGDPGSLPMDPHVLKALEQGVELGVGVAGSGVGRGPVLGSQPEDLLVVAVLSSHDCVLNVD